MGTEGKKGSGGNDTQVCVVLARWRVCHVCKHSWVDSTEERERGREERGPSSLHLHGAATTQPDL